MDPNSPVSIWKFKSVLFGATSSRFLLNCTVADILKENKFDENLEVFVDNLFSLLIKESEIQSAAANISKIFKHNGMPLHEFASNSAIANQAFNSQGILTESPVLKTLGLSWDYGKDNWFVNTPLFNIDQVTKRSLLSGVARIFDQMVFWPFLLLR